MLYRRVQNLQSEKTNNVDDIVNFIARWLNMFLLDVLNSVESAFRYSGATKDRAKSTITFFGVTHGEGHFCVPPPGKMWWPMQAMLWTFMQDNGAFLPIVTHTPKF